MDEKTLFNPGGEEYAEPESPADPVIQPDAPDIGEAPAPEMSADEMAALAGEFEKALHDIGEEQLESPAPFDIPIPGDAEVLPDIPAHDGATPLEQAEQEQTTPEAPAAEEKAPEKKGRGSRPPKAEKAEKAPGAEKPKKAERAPRQPKAPKQEKAAKTADKAKAPEKEEAAPPAPESVQPREAPRSSDKAEVVYLNISDLKPFKNHPFGVRDDAEMKSLVESVRDGGVNQPALVRPIEGGGYEMICGHRRQHASELAGFTNMPCIVREMTDDEAVIAMTDDNLRQRSEILPSEKAASIKMQVEAISHQGARGTSGQNVQKDAGQRSVDIVGERNNMNAKQVQRYMKLTDLVPDLMKLVDEKKLGFTSAVEISFIKPKNQNFIAVAMDSEQSSPSLSQAQRLRELDREGKLNGDVIDGILGEKKKEELKVIITGKELETYFGKDKTPQQMKGQIIKLLEDWAQKEKAIAPPEKKAEKDR